MEYPRNRQRAEGVPCSIDGCANTCLARGLCRMHYLRLYKTGSTSEREMPALEERFWAKVDKTGECWEWTAGCSPEGYGQFTLATGKKNGGKTSLAHRLAYQFVKGSIPDGLHLDHLCRNRRCVNPDHLEPVTPRINSLRGVGPQAINATKTHCLNGHPFDETNTYLPPGRSRRVCRVCVAARKRKPN